MWQGISFPGSTVNANSLLGTCAPLCAITCINNCAHVIDPVVHARVLWIMETFKHSSMHSRLGSMTRSQLAFPGESCQNFPCKKSQVDSTVVYVWQRVDLFLGISKNYDTWLFSGIVLVVSFKVFMMIKPVKILHVCTKLGDHDLVLK